MEFLDIVGKNRTITCSYNNDEKTLYTGILTERPSSDIVSVNKE